MRFYITTRSWIKAEECRSLYIRTGPDSGAMYPVGRVWLWFPDVDTSNLLKELRVKR